MKSFGSDLIVLAGSFLGWIVCAMAIWPVLESRPLPGEFFWGLAIAAALTALGAGCYLYGLVREKISE